MNKLSSVSKTKKKIEKGIKNKPPEANPAEGTKESNNPFDFGGLPIQDLKKNLGCG